MDFLITFTLDMNVPYERPLKGLEWWSTDWFSEMNDNRVGIEIVAEAPLLTAMWQKGEDSTNPQDNHIVKPPFELWAKGASGGFLVFDNLFRHMIEWNNHNFYIY